MHYALDRLGSAQFEHLVQSLALATLGPGVRVFGAGPDGGREATFEGELSVVDGEGRWVGYGVLQAKYKERCESPDVDATWLIARIRKELTLWADPDSERVRSGRLPDYFLVATNVRLSATPKTGGVDRVEEFISTFCREKKLPLKG